MNAIRSRQTRYGLAASLLVLSGSATSTPLSLAETPLITASGVKPNIMLIIDDSGSMDDELLMPTNDGVLWWHATDKSFVGRDGSDALSSAGVLNFNSAGNASDVWKKYVYLFPNGTTDGSRLYSDSTNDHFAVPPTGPFAYTRSADYNGMYYDPAQTYTPWVSDGDFSFSDINAASATSDPVRDGATLDLASDKTSSSANWVFRFYDGMVIPAGTHYRDWDTDSWVDAAADRAVTDTRNVGVRYYPATYYSRISTGTYTVSVSDVATSGNCASPSPAHYVAYAHAPSSLDSNAADALAPDGGCLRKYEIKDGNTFPSGRSYAAELQNFANWYSYYRKRHLALRAGAGKSFEGVANVRTGGVRINNLALEGMWDINTTRSSLYSFLYNSNAAGGTPNREALNYVGQQFDTNADVITHSCQQNFALLFTDGFANVSNVGVGNTDGDKGEPYADTHSNTMADIAMRYYATPLRSADFPPDSSAPVATPSGCGRNDTPAWLDCNSDLHMVTYGITLGAKGRLFGVSYFSVQDAYANPPAWADPTLTRNPVQVDDLFHAAVNGRGEMLNAGNATELQGALSTALNSIIARTQGSSASATANTGFVGSGTRVYQARFNSSDWTGQLLAFAVNSDTSSPTYGMLRTDGPGPDGSQWNAATVIPDADSRNIFTRSTSGGVPFRWTESLSVAQKAALGNSADVLNYIRGSAAGEVGNGGTYRNRATRLGDIVNSAPAFVGAPAFRYLDGLESQAYSAYKIAKRNRTKMIYVGANDGMLHGFNADTGVEVMAYVPGRVYGNLSALTNVDYAHKYYADGSPTVIDAFVNGSWRTVLVAGLNRGGQGIYALDVSDPANFTEDAPNPATLSLWEFTDANDVDLGYTYSQPAIVKLQTGQWAAIFGNGYNNTEADGNVSTTGRAVLYIVNLADGSLIKKIDTEVGAAQDPTAASRPNGLASVVAVDRDGDFLVDAVYGGDLFGNLWKFDLNSSTTSQWKVAYKSGNTPLPLFKACAGDSCTATNRQPITAAPSVGRHPSGKGMLVYFGTGKHLETTDNNGAAGGRQSFYAIWDNDAVVSGRSALRSQSITHEVAAGATGNPFDFDVRVTTNTAINWSSHKGWYLDLVSPGDVELGERQVVAPILRNNRIVFTTTIPSDNPCLPGGKSWLMEMDATSGSRLTFSPFDLNGDRQFSSADFVTITVGDEEVELPVSGIKMAGGGAATPNVMATEDGETKCISSLAGMECVRENSGPKERDRQSWRELGL